MWFKCVLFYGRTQWPLDRCGLPCVCHYAYACLLATAAFRPVRVYPNNATIRIKQTHEYIVFATFDTSLIFYPQTDCAQCVWIGGVVVARLLFVDAFFVVNIFFTGCCRPLLCIIQRSRSISFSIEFTQSTRFFQLFFLFCPFFQFFGRISSSAAVAVLLVVAFLLSSSLVNAYVNAA